MIVHSYCNIWDRRLDLSMVGEEQDDMTGLTPGIST